MRRLTSQAFSLQQRLSLQSRCHVAGGGATGVLLQQQRGGAAGGQWGNRGGARDAPRDPRRGSSGYPQQPPRQSQPQQYQNYPGGGYDHNDNRPHRQQQQQQQHQRPPRGVGQPDGREERAGGRGNPRRAPEQFLEQNAQALVELKRRFKQAKSAKERRSIQREARRLIRGTRVDPSTQDEKSVTVLLNCAATFHAPPSESVEQAVQWMRRNLNGLSPQNIALFANALGILQIANGETILTEEVSPVVQAVVKEMTPVEAVMVLQAFQRERIVEENADLQDTLLRQLSPCVSQMPVPQLSTLASVLARHAFKERDPAAWQGMVDAISSKALADVDRMHSKEAITFLTTAAHLHMPQAQMVQLLRRATVTAGYHTAEQVADLFRAMASIKQLTTEPSDELRQACAELEAALVSRLNRVAEFASVRDVASLWKFSTTCGVQLPAAVQERLAETLLVELAWVRQRFPQLARLAKAAALQKLPSVDALHAVGDYAVGRRAMRRDRDGQPTGTPDERSTEEISAARARLYAQFFASFVSLRLSLETAIAANGGQLTESIRTILPEELARHAAEATPRQALLAVEHIALAPEDCALRNTANDAALIAAVEERLRADPQAFREHLSPAFLKRFVDALKDAPKAKNVVDMLKTVEGTRLP